MDVLDKLVKIRTFYSSEDPIKTTKRQATSWESMLKILMGWAKVGFQLWVTPFWANKEIAIIITCMPFSIWTTGSLCSPSPVCLTEDLCPECMMSSGCSIIRQNPDDRMSKRFKQTLQRRRCKWPVNRWKDAQHLRIPGKCELKPRWGTPAHPLEQRKLQK